jgi:hypothetical protein
MTSSEPANSFVSYQKTLRAAGVFRHPNLASAALPVEGVGEIATCPLFEGGKAAALLPSARLRQAIILQSAGDSARSQAVLAID